LGSPRSLRATAASGRGLRYGAAAPRRTAALRRRIAAWRSAALLGAAAMALCGCGGGVGPLLVDPGQYDSYHCKDLTLQWTTLNDREKTLRNLTARASEGTGGAVIGALTYRTELETIAARRKLVQQEATEKKCELTTVYQSDQDIR
jgi:hypothetical protein